MNPSGDVGNPAARAPDTPNSEAVHGDPRFRALFDRLPEAAFLWQRDADGLRLLAQNAAAERLALPAVAGRVADSFSDACPAAVESLLQCLDRAAPEQWEGEVPGVDGELRWVQVSSVPLGADVAVSYLRDLTAVRSAERELRASEERAQALLRSNPEIVIRMTPDGRYVDCHVPDGMRGLLPLPPERYAGRTVAELHSEEFASRHAHYRRKAMSEGAAQFWQYARYISGAMHHFEARFVRTGDDEIVVTVRDETAHVAREREVLRIAERERRALGRELHDGLAQSLTAAHFLLEAVQDRAAGPAGDASGNVPQAAQLIRDAIGESRRLARDLGPLTIGNDVRFIEMLRVLAKEVEETAGLICSVDCHDSVPDVDAETLGQVFRILQEAATNAVRHGEAGKLHFVCDRVEDCFRFSVADDGCGIRVDDALAEPAGMGLTLMRYRARAIGAELAIGPGIAGGTVVECTLRLPQGA